MIVTAQEKDGTEILNITAQSGVFDPEEITTVAELWEEYRSKGPEKSGYHFIVLKDAGRVMGYACYGQRPLTVGTYDLYWIAVDPSCRRQGAGRQLLVQVEQDVCRLGGRLLVIETSGLEMYTPTRSFYLAAGYQLEATIRDFYKPGDDLVVFTKNFQTKKPILE